MFARFIADYVQGIGYIVGDGAPGPGVLYNDEIGQPRYGVAAVEDIGDILDE